MAAGCRNFATLFPSQKQSRKFARNTPQTLVKKRIIFAEWPNFGHSP
jgi:hypothetical protein